jgi:hypothetical protein
MARSRNISADDYLSAKRGVFSPRFLFVKEENHRGIDNFIKPVYNQTW